RPDASAMLVSAHADPDAALAHAVQRALDRIRATRSGKDDAPHRVVLHGTLQALDEVADKAVVLVRILWKAPGEHVGPGDVLLAKRGLVGFRDENVEQ